MASNNQYFGSTDHAPYIFGNLLRDLPSASTPLTDDTWKMANAAMQHADNGVNTLVFGLRAIGGLMLRAGMDQDNDDDPVISHRDFVALGELIQHLASEVYFLRETKHSLRLALVAYNQRGNDCQ